MQSWYILGEEESILFREVALFQGCPYKVPLFIHVDVVRG